MISPLTFGDSLPEFFSCLSFSPSANALVYAAQANPPADSTRFDYIPSLGERLQTRRRPTLFLLRWSEQSSSLVALQPSFPESLSTRVLFGQAAFARDDCLIARGYEYLPDGRMLGVVGMTNHPSTIWTLGLRPALLNANPSNAQTGPAIVECQRVSDPAMSARSPRVFLDEKRCFAVWLANPTGGTHAGASELHVLDLDQMNSDTRVRITSAPDGFPGLFADFIVRDPFVLLGAERQPAVVLQMIWGARKTVVLVTLQQDGAITRELTPVKQEGDTTSWSLLSTDSSHRVVCTCSTPTSVPQLFLGTLRAEGDISRWTLLDKPTLGQRGRRLPTSCAFPC